jgi:NAD dependent epimerase/dehydratase family enzyme
VNIVIPGGAGQVGAILTRAFLAGGHDVTILSRTPGAPQTAGIRTLPWDGQHDGPWSQLIDGADVVINLAGRSVNCRYTARHQRDIMQSRVDSTRAVGRAIAAARRPPRVWLQASTATIYAHTFGPPHDEAGALGGAEPDVPRSWDFSIDVARAWEAAATAFNRPRTRRVLMRSAIVLSPDRHFRRPAGPRPPRPRRRQRRRPTVRLLDPRPRLRARDRLADRP